LLTMVYVENNRQFKMASRWASLLPQQCVRHPVKIIMFKGDIQEFITEVASSTRTAVDMSCSPHMLAHCTSVVMAGQVAANLTVTALAAVATCAVAATGVCKAQQSVAARGLDSWGRLGSVPLWMPSALSVPCATLANGDSSKCSLAKQACSLESLLWPDQAKEEGRAAAPTEGPSTPFAAKQAGSWARSVSQVLAPVLASETTAQVQQKLVWATPDCYED